MDLFFVVTSPIFLFYFMLAYLTEKEKDSVEYPFFDFLKDFYDELMCISVFLPFYRNKYLFTCCWYQPLKSLIFDLDGKFDNDRKMIYWKKRQMIIDKKLEIIEMVK